MTSRFLIYLALAIAGMMGITLSMPLQAPAVILFGLAGVLAGGAILIKGLKVGESKVKGRKSEGLKESRGRDDSKVESLDFRFWSLISATRYLAIIATIYFVIRALTSPVFDLGMEDLMLILPAGLLYLMAGYGVTGKSGAKLRQGMAWTVIVLLILHLSSAILQLQGEQGFSLAQYFESTVRSGEGFVTGMYGYYGSFANFAVIAGLLCLSLGVWGRMAYFLRACLFVLGVVALAAALYSGSRSAAMSLAVALLVFVVLVAISFSGQSARVKKWGWIGVFVLGGGAMLVGIIGAVWVFQARGGNAEGVDTVFASAARTQYWPMAVEQWTDTPFFGAGSRSFSYECFRYWNPNLPTGAANPEFVHNEYLQLLADYGVVGLVLILGLFGILLTIAGKQVRLLTLKVGEDGFKKGSNAMALNIAGMCGMIAMAVHIIFDFRTHLLANLLLLVCCAVWVLPVLPVKGRKSEGLKVGIGSRGRDVLMGVFVIMLGMGTVGLGAYQFWGGMPLLENRMAKEDGSWHPEKVDRSVWIPALEASVQRVPTYKRYMRLGTLYRLDANAQLKEVGTEVEVGLLEDAKVAYEASIERNSFNPIPRINLAQIETEQGDFERADQLYASASEMAKARERWFRMHAEWAKLHQRWAIRLWKEKQWDEAQSHFERAKDLFEEGRKLGGFNTDKQWNIEYVSLLVTYARFRDEQHNFEQSEVLFTLAKQARWYYLCRVRTGLDFYYAQHLYERGYAMWMKRQPDEALKLMLQAKSCLLNSRGVMKGKVGKSWSDEMDKVQKVIDFLGNAGVGKSK